MSARDADQGAVLAFRRKAEDVEICLIRRRDSAQWGIPKGNVEDDEDPAVTALKEAREEAGITGRLIGGPIGSYRYDKWGAKREVSVFLMEVEAELDRWDEDWLRERCWMPRAQAAAELARHPVHRLLEKAFAALEKRR